MRPVHFIPHLFAGWLLLLLQTFLPLEGHSQSIQDHLAPVIHDWLILEPVSLANFDEAVFAACNSSVGIPQKDDVLQTPDGRTLKWLNHASPYQKVDLKDIFQKRDNTTTYACLSLPDSPAGPTTFRFESEGPSTVWLNQKMLLSPSDLTSDHTDARTLDVSLAKGDNVLIVKTAQFFDEWAFTFSSASNYKNTIQGVVLNPEGHVIPHASVALFQKDQQIDLIRSSASGQFIFNLKQPHDTLLIHVAHENLAAWSHVIKSSAGTFPKSTLNLVPTGSASGYVFLPGGLNPQQAALVEAVNLDNATPDTFRTTALTDHLGKYTFSSLPAGNYHFRIKTAAGFKYYTTEESTSSKPSQVKVRPHSTIVDLSIVTPTIAQGVWENYRTTHGLPHYDITALYESQDGALWIGTKGGGVALFDGLQFQNYDIKDGLPSQQVLSLAQTPDNALLIGTEDGLTVFKDSVITVYQKEFPQYGLDLYTLETTKEGSVWVGTSNGIMLYEKGRFSPFQVQHALPSKWINDIHEAQDGSIWIATSNGASHFDGQTLNNLDLLAGLNVKRIIQSRTTNAIWFATTKGLYRFDGTTLHRFAKPNGLPHNEVHDLCEEPNGNLWIATNGGLARYDGSVFTNYTKMHGLANNQVNSIACTSNGIVWAGTQQGLSKLTHSVSNFSISQDASSKKINPGIFAMSRTSSGDVILGTEWGGVFTFDGRALKRNEDFERELYVRALLPEDTSRLWLGTHLGLLRYEKGAVHRVSPKSWVMTLTQDTTGIVWYGTAWMGGGVSRYDPVLEQELPPLTLADGLANDQVWALETSVDGSIWIGTGTGIAHYVDGKFVDESLKNGFEDMSVLAIKEAPDQSVWFATHSGLFKYDQGIWTSITTEGLFEYNASSRKLIDSNIKLPDNALWSIHFSADGTLWLGTQARGLISFDGKAFSIMDERNGLIGNQVMAIDSDAFGNMWAGTLDGGLTVFQKRKQAPHLSITGLQVNGNTYTDLESIPKIHDREEITFIFDDIDLITPLHLRQYLVQIHDNKGYLIDKFITTQRTATWFTPSTGDFWISIQSIGQDLNYSPPVTLGIQVISPWFRNPWILISGLATILGLVAGLIFLWNNAIRQRAINLDLHAQMLRQEKKDRAKLENTNTELKKAIANYEQQASELRQTLEENKELLGVTSHDLKNPLGGIIGMIPILIEDIHDLNTTETTEIISGLSLLQDEAERMLSIVTNVLDNHRHGEEMEINLVVNEIGRLIEQVIHWNRNQADAKKMTIHFKQECLSYACVDAVAFQRVIDNLVSNAVKYGPLNSTIQIKLDAYTHALTDENRWRFSVRDEGPGLTEEDLKKVFGKMQRLSAKPTAGEHSTGLGLYIVKQIVQQFGGKVGVDSKAGQGATFWIDLPAVKLETAPVES